MCDCEKKCDKCGAPVCPRCGKYAPERTYIPHQPYWSIWRIPSIWIYPAQPVPPYTITTTCGGNTSGYSW